MEKLPLAQYFTVAGLIVGSAEMARNQPSTNLVAEANEKFFIESLKALEHLAQQQSLKRTLTNAKQAREYFATYRGYPGKPCYGDVHMQFHYVDQAAKDDLNEMFTMCIPTDGTQALRQSRGHEKAHCGRLPSPRLHDRHRCRPHPQVLRRGRRKGTSAT